MPTEEEEYGILLCLWIRLQSMERLVIHCAVVGTGLFLLLFNSARFLKTINMFFLSGSLCVFSIHVIYRCVPLIQFCFIRSLSKRKTGAPINISIGTSIVIKKMANVCRAWPNRCRKQRCFRRKHQAK